VYSSYSFFNIQIEKGGYDYLFQFSWTLKKLYELYTNIYYTNATPYSVRELIAVLKFSVRMLWCIVGSIVYKPYTNYTQQNSNTNYNIYLKLLKDISVV